MQTRNLIRGEWVGADSGEEFEVRNPATDEVIASVPDCRAAETGRAIRAASEALPRWSALPAHERAGPLRRLADLMMAERDRLAALMTEEQGKPLSESRGEIAYAASFIEWAGEEAKRVYGDTVPASTADKRILVLRQPIGVAAAITPWNFPAAMITRKLGPALACGCTMVVKPAEQTPLSALALGELAMRAGLPPGVVNIITGEPDTISDELFANPLVRKVSFTGSTQVGRVLLRKSSQNITNLSLELGGHAPFIVFDDADVDAAVRGLIASKFRNAGQTCICANRVYVQGGVYERFLGALKPAVEALRVGRGDVEGVHIGPLINDGAVSKVRQHVEDAVSHGARVLTGGGTVQPGGGLTDRFFAPTILEGCTRQMLVCQEETFGPVVPVIGFQTEDEALAMANDTPYGLAAYFYTRDAARLMRVAEALEYGIVGANDGAPSTAQAPFGGVKQSGFGREGGRYAMEEYLQTKYVSWSVG